MASDFATTQIKLLQSLGFLFCYSQGKSKGFNRCHLRNGVALCLLLGGWICCGFDFAQSFAIFAGNTRYGSLANVVINMPYCTLILRPLLILSITYCKRSAFRNLSLVLVQFLQNAFPDDTVFQDIKVKWRNRSIVLFILSAALMLFRFTFYVEWVFYRFPQFNFFGVGILAPLPVALQFWQWMLIWLIFQTFNFILSQQVLIILLIYASLLAEALESVNLNIGEAIDLNRQSVSCQINSCHNLEEPIGKEFMPVQGEFAKKLINTSIQSFSCITDLIF
jgi:hypothetical protein